MAVTPAQDVLIENEDARLSQAPSFIYFAAQVEELLA